MTAENGTIFLGRDEATYGKDGIGWVNYNPEYECVEREGIPGRQCPFEPDETSTMGFGLSGNQKRRLHVGIASYRDPLCPKTLYNLFTKASQPEKIQVRVIQQNIEEEDEDCLLEYCRLMGSHDSNDNPNNDALLQNCPHADQVFIHQINARTAAGPMWARGILSKDMEKAHRDGELKQQDHCMSIDSHMDFEPEWDRKMVEMWDLAKNEYAVLSTYVASTDQLGVNLNHVHEVPHLCMVTFTSNVRVDATKCARNLIKPKLTNAIWGAGLSFSKCHAELKVMVDPHTQQIFDGEEFNRAARFWTYGYDIYTPHRVYVLHDYKNSQSNPKTRTWGTNDRSGGNKYAATKRLLTMIDVPGGETNATEALKVKRSKYGLGDRRTLDQLIEFSGIDLRNRKKTIDGVNRCGNIKWVPFIEHPHGVNYIPNFDDETEEPLDLDYDEGSVWKTTENALNKNQKVNLSLPHDSIRRRSQQKHGSKEYTDFLVMHDTTSSEEHGFSHLPIPVQLSAIILCFAFFVPAFVSAKRSKIFSKKQ